MYTLLFKEVEVDMNKKSNVSICLDTQHVYVLHVCAFSFLFFFFFSFSSMFWFFLRALFMGLTNFTFQQIFH